MKKLTLGRTRLFRPICIQHPHGFYGGPAGYEETTDPSAKTLILKAIMDGKVPLFVAEDMLDSLENQERIRK